MAYTQAQTADWLARLKAAGVDEASFDLRHILLAAADVGEAEIMIARRANREPLSHILGDKPFWTLDLKVTRDVLTPRADTEALVEAVLNHVADKEAQLTLADFGTGSGAILLALLSELPNASGLGIDISESALEVAKQNAIRNRIGERASFEIGNWADGIPDESLDIAVSNPPYIASEVIEALEAEVKDHEPRIALDGGVDGLEVYRLLLPQLFRVLKPGGMMAVEIGFDQAEPVSKLASEAEFDAIEIIKDLTGHDRVILGHKREK